MATSDRKCVGIRLSVLLAVLIPNIVVATTGITLQDNQTQATVTTGSTDKVETANANAPSFTDYRGIRIGMSANEVREKLGKPKSKDSTQDVYALAGNESAQVFYDAQGNVFAISIDFTGEDIQAPTPRDVLGEDLTARADGSMYQMKQYRDAGYWVSYNRTSSDPPQITITMQKMP